MSNKKFSEFTLQTDSSNVAFVVGFNGSDNVRISPSNLIGSGFLPVSGGTMTGNLLLQDNIQVQVGTGADLKIYHNATDSFIENQTGILKIQSSVVDGDISFLADNGSGTATEYFRLDGSATETVFSKDLRIIDSEKLIIGTDGDFQVFHNGSQTILTQQGTGDLIIQNTVNDADITFSSDDGSGGVTAYITLDGSQGFTTLQKAIRAEDNVNIQAGSSGDLRIFHNGTNSTIQNVTGNVIIENTVDDADIIFKSDDGSGGITEYFRLDGGTEANIFSKNVGIETGSPSAPLMFGKSVYGAFDSEDFYRIKFQDQGGVNNDVGIGQTASGNMGFNITSGNAFIFNNGTSGEIARFNGTGLGIGTTSPDSLLEISSSSVSDFLKLTSGGSSANPIKFIFEKSSTEQGIIEYNRNGDLEIYNTDSDGGVMIDGSTSAGADFYINNSGDASFGGNVALVDNAQLRIGSSTDLQILHDASDSFIINNTGDLYLRNLADDKDIIFQSDDGSGGVETYFRLDGSANSDGNPRTIFPDNAILALGTSQDFTMQHNATNTEVVNVTGNLNIKNSATDGNISFFGDDASSGVMEYFRLDGGNVNMITSVNNVFVDNKRVQFGDSADLAIYHTGTNSIIENTTGVLKIQSSLTDGDISFIADDGSGGTTEYFRVDGGTEDIRFSKNTRHLDNVRAEFGNSGDFDIYYDGSNAYVVNGGSAAGDIQIINNTDDGDIKFFSDDGTGSTTEYFRLNGDNTDIIFSKPIELEDNVELRIGSSGADLRMLHNGTNSFIQNFTGDLEIQQEAADKDILFRCDDGSGSIATYFFLDGSSTDVRFLKNTRLDDNVQLQVGSGADLQISHDGTDSVISNTTGNLTITNSADDKDIIFKTDDGSGGTTEYLTIDGSQTRTLVSKNLDLLDNVRLRLGTGDAADQQDLQIYHDGTDSQIKNRNGDLKIEVSADDKDIVFRGDDGSGGITTYVQLDGSEVSTKILTQKVIMSNLPTSDPNNSGQLYNDSGVLKVSAG